MGKKQLKKTENLKSKAYKRLVRVITDISVSTLDDNVKAEQLAKNSLVTEWKFEM